MAVQACLTLLFCTARKLLVKSARHWSTLGKLAPANSVDVPPKGSKPSAIDRFNARAGIENYKNRLLNDPASFVSFFSKKFLRLWYAGESGRNDAIILSVNGPIYLFAVTGLVLAWRRKMLLAWVPFSIVAYFILVHWVSLPLFRYLMPVMPYLIGFAAFAIISIFERVGIMRSSCDIARNC